jgi:hypothetical protein
MATQKYPLTGSTKRERAKPKSKLKDAGEAIANTVEKIADASRTAGDTAKSIATGIGSVANSIGNIAESVGLSSTGHTTREIKTHDAYGGVEITAFTPQSYLATDLFSDSSTLDRTDKVTADAVVNSIEEKRQTLRIVGANLDLNTDVLKTGVKSEKMTQSSIDYGIAKVGTDTKLVQFDNVKVNYEIALTKLDQTTEKLSHEQVTLEGLRNETDQRKRFWQEKYQLGESRIKQVELAKYQLDAKIGAIDVEGEMAE